MPSLKPVSRSQSIHFLLGICGIRTGKMSQILCTKFALVSVTLFFNTAVFAEFVYEDGKGYTIVPANIIPQNTSSLHLENNLIVAIDWFPILPDLLYLTLSGNLLTEFPQLLNVSSKLQHLYLDQNNISYIAYDRLNHMTSLNKLMFSDNWLTATAFPDVPDTILSYLDLSGNQMQSTPSFPNLGKLLKTLYLDRNMLTYLSEENLPNMTALNVLSVSGNQLTNLTHLPKLPALTRIVLSLNPITEWPDFSNLPSLTELFFDTCLLMSVPMSNLSLLPIAKLHLHENSIALENIEDAYIPTLSELKLGANELPEFPRWQNLSLSIIRFYLDYNYISELNDSNLDSFPQLAILDMSHNNLEEFPKLNSNGGRLTNFNLAYNKIAEIPLGDIEPLKFCSSLNMQNNHLTSIPNLCMADFNVTIKISLSYNPFHCDLALLQSVKSVVGPVPFQFDDLNTAKCASPLYLKDYLLSGDLPVESTFPYGIENSGKFLSQLERIVMSISTANSVSTFQIIYACSYHYQLEYH